MVGKEVNIWTTLLHPVYWTKKEKILSKCIDQQGAVLKEDRVHVIFLVYILCLKRIFLSGENNEKAATTK